MHLGVAHKSRPSLCRQFFQLRHGYMPLGVAHLFILRLIAMLPILRHGYMPLGVAHKNRPRDLYPLLKTASWLYAFRRCSQILLRPEAKIIRLRHGYMP